MPATASPFKRILVPLDGSRLAESVLPAVVHLARTTGSAVVLVHIVEPKAPVAVHGDRHLRAAAEAEAYLAEVAARHFPPGVAVTCHVHVAPTAIVVPEIVSHTMEFSSDLVVMCSHGRDGLRKFLFGNLAQHVVADGATPVLLLRPGADSAPCAEVSGLCRDLLVPLDGSAEHERVLPLAINLARLCAGTLHLVYVVPTRTQLAGDAAGAGRLLPNSTRAVLELAEAQAVEYLRQQVAAVKHAGAAARGTVCRDEPLKAIVAAAAAANATLVVLGTHGVKGAKAFWGGSLTPKLLQRLNLPLLLVPVR